MDLGSSVQFIKGIGENRAKLLNKLGIYTLRDLISYFPRDYEDRTKIYSIADLPEGAPACTSAMIASSPRVHHIRKGLDIVRVRAVDDQYSLDISFFNQAYIKDALIPGQTYIFYGLAEGKGAQKTMANPVFEPLSAAGTATARIMPIYRLTAGISNHMLSKAIGQGLTACGDILPDVLPDDIRVKYQLAHARFAYENIHNPADFDSLSIARNRLIFEEFFIFSAGLLLLKNRRGTKTGLSFSPKSMEDFYAALPFTLTKAQMRAIHEAVSDMSSGAPMNRLVQGDVGSGKTMVAAACAYFAKQNGYQTALMAPTEILAEQHYKSLLPLMEQLGLSVCLLTGSLKRSQKRQLYDEIELGMADLVIGTHALISQSLVFLKLGLVIADEQHRFGVEQRAALTAKGANPHILVMSATPIPRTLALILYSDLDVSIIDELPPGRKSVDTFLVTEKMRPRIYAFIEKQVKEGRQVFIVCPMVDEGDELGLKSAEEYAEDLQNRIFPHLKVALIHGRMKGSSKDAIMAGFSRGEYDILVSTTVIEVGVDIPNASLMVIENAERFGLSQLHQLRGRVGRGAHQSYCVLFSESKNEETLARLKALCKTADGFQIAEEDLKLRGPGDFFGSRQHGLPEFRIASLAGDIQILRQAQAAAMELLKQDPNLSSQDHRLLMEQIRLLFSNDGDIFN